VGRHAASNDSTVSPPRLNPRTLRDLHDTLTAPLDDASLDADPIDAIAINAEDLIARFRASGMSADVARRTAGPAPTGSGNSPAPLPLLKKPVLEKALAPKSAAAKVGLATSTIENVAPAPAAPLRVADLLDRHPDLAAGAPRTGHRATGRTTSGAAGRNVSGRPVSGATGRNASGRPPRVGVRTLSALRPAPSIRVPLRPVLTVAAIVTAFTFVEAPNLRTSSQAPTDPRAGRSTSTSTTATAPTSANSTLAAASTAVTTAADLPRHGGAVTTATSSSGRVSRSTRRAIGVAAHHVPLLKPGQTVAGTWIRPSSGRYTSCFCSRWGSFHAGIDLASKLGTPILAVGDGTVLKAGPASGFGNWVVIAHSNGDVSIYGHMKYFFVHAGQKVKAGEKIAVVGDQGFSTGPHLHFEVHKGGLGGTKINPIPWLKARGIVIGSLSKDG
jgi:murein DD-endopeptidase MepM/ murein hydrolase activator NlpD